MFYTRRQAQVWLWCGFIALNTLLMLPLYLIYGYGESEFFPLNDLTVQTASDLYQLTLIRQNYDVFRLSSDLVLMTLLLWLVRNTLFRRPVQILVFFAYLICLVFDAYYWVFEKFLGGANIYDDMAQLSFMREIIENDIGDLVYVYILGAVFGVLCLFWLFRRFSEAVFLADRVPLFGKQSSIVKYAPAFMLSRWVQVVVIIIIIITVNQIERIHRKKLVLWPELTIHSTISRMYKNVTESESEEELKSIKTHISSYSANRDISIDQNPPNIYFLFIESYGEIVTTSETLQGTFLQQFDVMNKRFGVEGWHASSNLSRSTTTGGRSWLAYTSFLNGFRLDSHKHYLEILKYSPSYEYPSLPKILQRSGYKNIRLSSIRKNKKVFVPISRLNSFHSIDKWVTHEDLNYNGRHYGFGPSPPDQYALNFAHEYIRSSDIEEPYTLFFITQNSHNPFVPDLRVVEDWRKLSDGSKTLPEDVPSNFFSLADINDYKESIRYQLNMIADFIVNQGSEKDVFVVIGDHQPPLIASSSDRFHTPVHIISKDQEFVKAFGSYGFVDGMLYETENSVSHEGFHHAFLRELVRFYSSEKNVPSYHPYGVGPSQLPDSNE